ncbi:hypothetical protein B0H13DRAFT_1849649 [Mycena leptocephala]|nr:hypothetical protein B0H13DRAFT_1849649 [Mycena leptocephala]
MEDCLRQTKCEAIGVSNFSIKIQEPRATNEAHTKYEFLPGFLGVKLNVSPVKPAMNQVEMHPYLAQNDLLAFCKEHDIAVVAYMSSVRGEHQKENFNVGSPKRASRFPMVIRLQLPTLEDKDIKKIDGLDHGERICNKADENGLVYGMSYENLGW